MPEDDAAQLFRPQIFDGKQTMKILQQNWRLICILNNFCKDTIFVHFFANAIFMLAFKHQSNFGFSLLTSLS